MKKLPRSYFHMLANNPAEQSLWGRIPIESVHCFLLYKKDSTTQDLLHSVKYRGEKELGMLLGEVFVQELSEMNKLSDVDVIIPVPLHPKKEFRRGYNQSLWIANGVKARANLPINSDILIKCDDTTSQTRKKRFSRYLATKSMFAINDSKELENKHILLVDDVLTTGATVEACYRALSKTPNIKLSVLTLAYSTC